MWGRHCTAQNAIQIGKQLKNLKITWKIKLVITVREFDF